MAVDPSHSAALSPALAQQLAERASGQLAQDQRSLDGLQRAARDNPRAAIRQAAVQFQALFVQQVLKSMRDSTVKSGLFESHANDTYTSMLDQQLSLKVASGAKGLADVIASQLSRSLPQEAGASPGARLPQEPGASPGAVAPGALRPLPAAAASAAAASAAATASAATPAPTPAQVAAARAQEAVAGAAGCAWFAGDEAAESNAGDDASPPSSATATQTSNAPWSASAAATPAADPLAPGAAAETAAAVGAGSDPTRAAFVARLGRHARVAEQLTGIPAQFILGQAALETGWGRHEMRSASGASSHNLFGIKAGPDWNGRTVAVATTEYQNGVAKRVVQQFRAYNSDADSFRDWAQLVAGSPRYAGVVRQGRTASGFAQGLQQAGYATDPAYGAKLMRAIDSLSPSRGVLVAGRGLKFAGPTPT